MDVLINVMGETLSQGTCIGLAQKFLQFLSKNKRPVFHFHQELYWITYSPFCSTTFCHFSSNFIIPSSQTFYLFDQRTVPGSFYLLLLKRNKLKFFPLIEFCTDRNKWKSESSVPGEFVFSRLVVLDFLQPHGRTQQARLPCPSPSPGACLTHVH